MTISHTQLYNCSYNITYLLTCTYIKGDKFVNINNYVVIKGTINHTKFWKLVVLWLG